MQIIKLGTKVKDIASKSDGMLTHFCYSPTSQLYIFQPNRINVETGHPVSAVLIDPSRIANPVYEEADLPVSILGTDVKDKATGIKGRAIGIVYHMSGCVHIELQPEGQTITGGLVKPVEIDILRLEGKEIKKLTEAEVKQRQKEKPSPMAHPSVWDC